MLFILGDEWFWGQFYALPVESQEEWIQYWEEQAEQLAADYAPIMPRLPSPEKDEKAAKDDKR